MRTASSSRGTRSPGASGARRGSSTSGWPATARAGWTGCGPAVPRGGRPSSTRPGSRRSGRARTASGRKRLARAATEARQDRVAHQGPTGANASHRGNCWHAVASPRRVFDALVFTTSHTIPPTPNKQKVRCSQWIQIESYPRVSSVIAGARSRLGPFIRSSAVERASKPKVPTAPACQRPGFVPRRPNNNRPAEPDSNSPSRSRRLHPPIL